MEELYTYLHKSLDFLWGIHTFCVKQGAGSISMGLWGREGQGEKLSHSIHISTVICPRLVNRQEKVRLRTG